jgi:hypothetical protein
MTMQRRCDADAARALLLAAQWRGRALARATRARRPGDHAELCALADCCCEMLAAIREIFGNAAAGATAIAVDRQSVDELLAPMQAAERAVQRAHAAGVSWDAIQNVTQLAWPLACQTFEVLGWAEAFRAAPGELLAEAVAGDRTISVGQPQARHADSRVQ